MNNPRLPLHDLHAGGLRTLALSIRGEHAVTPFPFFLLTENPDSGT
jgi:hypothetical protein